MFTGMDYGRYFGKRIPSKRVLANRSGPVDATEVAKQCKRMRRDDKQAQIESLESRTFFDGTVYFGGTVPPVIVYAYPPPVTNSSPATTSAAAALALQQANSSGATTFPPTYTITPTASGTPVQTLTSPGTTTIVNSSQSSSGSSTTIISSSSTGNATGTVTSVVSSQTTTVTSGNQGTTTSTSTTTPSSTSGSATAISVAADARDSTLFDSSATSSSYGIAPIGGTSSIQQAAADAGRVTALRSLFEQVGAQYGIPPALLAGIASRESNVGASLGLGPNAPGWGDNNNGYGIMQIDVQNAPDTSTGPAGIANIQQGAQILAGYMSQVRAAHPSWTSAQILRGATAAYNEGVSNVRTLSGMDMGTTGNNYSGDVWARAQYFAQNVFK